MARAEIPTKSSRRRYPGPLEPPHDSIFVVGSVGAEVTGPYGVRKMEAERGTEPTDLFDSAADALGDGDARTLGVGRLFALVALKPHPPDDLRAHRVCLDLQLRGKAEVIVAFRLVDIGAELAQA